jgi:aspartate/methionine/tyrosine aminotransferase
MNKANTLNKQIESSWPAAAALLSSLGLRAAFPDGVPAQAAEAKACEFNGSIGQVTDGHGNALPLASLSGLLGDLDRNRALLYPPQLGIPLLRELWRKRVASRVDDLDLAPPMVTVALTHGISLCADLFSDAQTTVLLPSPGWGNYKAVFGLRREAKLATWNVFTPDMRFNVKGFKSALAGITGRCVVVLNFPGNPTGYSPTAAEADALVAALLEHPQPVAIICDDAYQGMVYEQDAIKQSIFYRIQPHVDPTKHLLIKIDGATKELAFFGGRVGFLTFATDKKTAESLLDKAAAIARATVSSAPAPSQVAVMTCLQNETLEDELAQLHATLEKRYRKLRSCLPMLESAGVHAFPFNSGCFSLLRLPPGRDPHTLRKKLIQSHSVGLIALPSERALRVAYCSMHKDQIEEALTRLAKALD